MRTAGWWAPHTEAKLGDLEIIGRGSIGGNQALVDDHQGAEGCEHRQPCGNSMISPPFFGPGVFKGK
jgi:hypothetical protein